MPPRLLLINPWIYDFAAANLWASPLGLLQVAEWLSAYTPSLFWLDCLEGATAPPPYHVGKFSKTVLPAPAPLAWIRRRYGRYGISRDEFSRRLRAALPLDAILITGIMTYWYPGVQAAVRLCRELAPGVPVILGGIYARLCPEHARRNSGADEVYSQALGPDLLGVFSRFGLDLKPRRAALPYYRLDFYSPLPYAPLFTSAGCPCACSYCACARLHDAYRRFPLPQVLQALRELHALGATDFAFYDDALLHGAEGHLQPLLREVVRLGLPVRLHTPNGLHARWLDARTARLMRAAHFKTLRLGLETVNPARQRSTGDKVRCEDVERAVSALKDAGFSKQDIGVYLMYGLPGQSWGEVEDGVAFLRELGVRICLTEYSPIPGTPLWEEMVRAGSVDADLDPLLTNNSVFALWRGGETRRREINDLKNRVTAYNRSESVPVGRGHNLV